MQTNTHTTYPKLQKQLKHYEELGFRLLEIVAYKNATILVYDCEHLANLRYRVMWFCFDGPKEYGKVMFVNSQDDIPESIKQMKNNFDYEYQNIIEPSQKSNKSTKEQQPIAAVEVSHAIQK